MLIQLLPYLLCLIPVSLIILSRPWLGVVLLFFFQVFLAKTTAGLTIAELIYAWLFVITLTAWLLKNLYQDQPFPRKTLILSSLLFIIYCLVSVVIALSRNIPLLNWLKQWYTFSPLLLILPIITEFKDQKRLKILIITFLVTATIVSLLGIASNLSKGKIISYKTGIASTIYLWATILMLGLIGYLKHGLWFWLLGGLLLIGLVRSLADLSRIGIASVSLGASIIAVFTFLSKKHTTQAKRRYLRLTVLSILIISLVSFSVLPHLINKINQAYSGRLSLDSLRRSAIIRYLVMRAALDDWQQSPVVGQGFGYNLGETFRVQPHPLRTVDIGEVHNLYIYLLSHGGLIGLGLYLIILSCLLKQGFAAFRRATSRFNKGLTLGFLAGCLAFLVFVFSSVRGSRIETQSFLALAGGIFILKSQTQNKQLCKLKH